MSNIEASVKDNKGMELIVDDIVKGVSPFYGITDTNMTRGRILEIDGNNINVRVLSHISEAGYIGESYWVEAKDFEKIGHVKPFVREEFLENLAKGEVNYIEYDLYGADLRSADLRSADLRSANLRSADLRSANLSGADLRSADLRSADLRSANLSGADLRSADLRSANLRSADLRSANLRSADLRSADLREVKYDECTAFFAMVCPEEGSFIGWKVCCKGLIVKLRITEDAKRSSATTRKCRCSKAEVIAIEDVEGNPMPEGTVAYSQHDHSFTYEIGKTVEVTDFDEDRWCECSTGIHFFITRKEAVLYYC